MRRFVVAGFALLGVAALLANCSKKKASPMAPPADPACSLSPTSLAFGIVPVGSNADRQLILRNTGGGTLSGTLAESCTEFSLIGGTGYTLSAGQSDTLTVRFSPVSPGPKNCTLQTGSLQCATVACSGEGQPTTPACEVSTSLIDLGTLLYGRSRDELFAIQNTGGGTLSGAVTGAVGDFSLVDQTTFALTASQFANLRVRFIPTSSGAQACTLSLGTPTCAPVIVRAVGELEFYGHCAVSVTSDTIDFGQVSVGFPATRQFTLKNGSANYIARGSVSDVCSDFEGTNFFDIFPGGTSTGNVQFTPSREGPQICALPVNCRNDGEGTNPGVSDYVICRGVGVGGTPACQLSTSTLDFGQVVVGQSRDLQFMVTNSGTGALSGSIGPSHCGVFSFIGATTYSLGPGKSATFTLRFTPTQVGHTITCSEIPMGSVCAGLTAIGEGVGPPSCQVSPTTLEFGSVTVGQTKDLTFDVRNGGGGTLCGSVTEACVDFSVVQNASYCATPPGFVRVTVRFAPSATGLQQCTISPGATCSSITVRGTGT